MKKKLLLKKTHSSYEIIKRSSRFDERQLIKEDIDADRNAVEKQKKIEIKKGKTYKRQRIKLALNINKDQRPSPLKK